MLEVDTHYVSITGKGVSRIYKGWFLLGVDRMRSENNSLFLYLILCANSLHQYIKSNVSFRFHQPITKSEWRLEGQFAKRYPGRIAPYPPYYATVGNTDADVNSFYV